MKILPLGVVPCGQTDIKKLIAALHSFATASN